MKKLKKFLAIGCTAMMVVTAAGCSSTSDSSEAVEDTTQEATVATQDSATTDTNTEDTTTETADETTAESADETTTDKAMVVGKVTAIDGTSITLSLGEMPQSRGAGNGEAPTNADNTKTKPETDGTTTDAATPPSGEAPKGNAPSDQVPTDAQDDGEKVPSPDGQKAEGQMPDISAMFTESGETLIITVEDESLIQIVSGTETTTGSLSDITVDTILNIAYDDSDNIMSIMVQSAGK
jgi:hypothetical protein